MEIHGLTVVAVPPPLWFCDKVKLTSVKGALSSSVSEIVGEVADGNLVFTPYVLKRFFSSSGCDAKFISSVMPFILDFGCDAVNFIYLILLEVVGNVNDSKLDVFVSVILSKVDDSDAVTNTFAKLPLSILAITGCEVAVGFFVFVSVIEDITNVTGSIELLLAVASGKEVLFVSVVIVSLSKIVDDVTGNIALLVLFLTIVSDDKGGIPVWLCLISAVVEYVVGVAVSYDSVVVASPIPVLTGTKDTFISFLISSLFEVDWDEIAVNVAFITSVIKVLDLTGNVEDLSESVISAWEVVIVFVLPFEINVTGNVFGAAVVFVSLWSGVTVSKAAVFSFQIRR